MARSGSSGEQCLPEQGELPEVSEGPETAGQEASPPYVQVLFVSPHRHYYLDKSSKALPRMVLGDSMTVKGRVECLLRGPKVWAVFACPHDTPLISRSHVSMVTCVGGTCMFNAPLQHLARS